MSQYREIREASTYAPSNGIEKAGVTAVAARRNTVMNLKVVCIV